VEFEEKVEALARIYLISVGLHEIILKDDSEG